MNIFTIAHLTLFEARRKRIVTAAALCGAAFLTVFALGLFGVFNDLARKQATFIERQTTIVLLTVAGLYAVTFLSVLFAVLLPVDAISGEIDSGVMQTIASKPIRRSDVLLGKWLGHWVVVATYLILVEAWRARFGIRRLVWHKANIDDVADQLNALPPMPVFVTFVHAHVHMDSVLDRLRWDAAFTLACCLPGHQLTQTRAPLRAGVDPCVLSTGRQFQVLVNPDASVSW